MEALAEARECGRVHGGTGDVAHLEQIVACNSDIVIASQSPPSPLPSLYWSTSSPKHSPLSLATAILKASKSRSTPGNCSSSFFSTSSGYIGAASSRIVTAAIENLPESPWHCPSSRRSRCAHRATSGRHRSTDRCASSCSQISSRCTTQFINESRRRWRNSTFPRRIGE